MYHIWLVVQQADKTFQVKGQGFNQTGRDKPIQQKCPVDRDGDPPLQVQSLTIT